MRFQIVELEKAREVEPEEYGDEFWEYDQRNFLLDVKHNKIVFVDGGEPEDNSLDRDLFPLVQLLNEVSER